MAKAHSTARFQTTLCAALVCAWWVLLTLSASARAQDQSGGASSADIRLLVDVSGSMNQSDPQNLRAEGLALLSKMLPADTHAGLWRFAGQVSEVVPAAAVTKSWRQRTADSLQTLRSDGQLTDIGAALARAARAPVQAERAHLLLLTDGKVDIGDDPERNRRERASILTELLPRLIARGFVIHTIALSNDADAELLQSLASESAGEHRVVTNRDELVSIFVDILDQAVPPQRLPVSGDGFVVDSTVDELTVLIYHLDTQAQRPHLLDPDLLPVSEARHDDAVRWLSRPRYDLVTIPSPKNGRWQLVGGGRDARVTVLTDLTLHVQPLAQTVLPGEPMNIRFVLREREQVLTDHELLEHVRAHVSVGAFNADGVLGEPTDQDITLRSTDTDGYFLLRTSAPETPGDYQLNLRIDGATFAREYQRRFEVDSTFAVLLQKQPPEPAQGQAVAYRVAVTAASVMDVEHTEIVAHIKNSAGTNSLQALKLMPDGVWELTVTPTQRARYVIELQAKGVDQSGRRFSQTLEPQYFTYPAEGDPQPPPADDTLSALEQALADERAALARELNTAAPEPPAVEPEPAASSSSSSVADVPPSTPKNEGTRWWLVALVLLFNVALLALIYWLYRRFSGKSMESELDELEQQLTDNDEADTGEQEPPEGAFDDVFADMGELTSASASADVSSSAEPDVEADAIQLDDDDPMAALDELTDVVPEPPDVESDEDPPASAEGDSDNQDKDRP